MTRLSRWANAVMVRIVLGVVTDTRRSPPGTSVGFVAIAGAVCPDAVLDQTATEVLALKVAVMTKGVGTGIKGGGVEEL